MNTRPVTAGLHLALMATMVVWALNVTAVKWLAGVMDFTLVASLRMVCAVVALALLLFFSRQHFPRWRGRMLLLACASALLLVYGNQMLFAKAMETTTATNAALILALNPLINGVLEALVFRKPLTGRYLTGALLAVTGVCLVVLNRANVVLAGPSFGDLLVLGSMLSFACGVLALQRLSRESNPLAINVFLYAAGALALCVHSAAVIESPLAALRMLGWRDWLVVAFSGIGATAFGALAWARGVAAMGAGRAAVYMAWVPVLGVAFGALLLDEPLSVWHLVGMVLVLMGTVLSVLKPASAARPPAVVECKSA